MIASTRSGWYRASMAGPSDRSRRLESAILVAAYVAVQVLSLLEPGFVERDPEELFSAGQAWLAMNGDLRWFFHMQYRPFCGGCSVHAASAMALFSVLPATWMVWKILPIGWGVAGLLVGRRVLAQHVGPAAATAFGLLWLLPPRAFANLSLVAWGNHYEAGVIALVAAWLALGEGGTGRRLALGVLLGFGVYVSFSAGFIAVVCLLWIASRERLRGAAPLLAGVPLGLAGWGAQWLTAGQHPFHTIYEARESVPDPTRFPAELWTLLAPRQLAGLFGAGGDWFGMALGVGVAAVVAGLGWAGWRQGGAARFAAAACAGFVLVYGLTGFSVKVPEHGVMYPGGLRYAAPLFPPAFLLVAAVAGRWWSGGRRALAVAALALPLASGAVGRTRVLGGDGPDWSRFRHDAVDWTYLRERLSFMVPMDGHSAGAAAADRRTRDVHAYALGREAATAALRGPGTLDGVVGRGESCAFWEGVADAVHQEQVSVPLDDVCGARQRVRQQGEADGETWAHGAGWAPGPMAAPPDANAAWAWEAGYGLGRRWGPRAAVPWPDGLDRRLEPELAEGYVAGMYVGWWQAGERAPRFD